MSTEEPEDDLSTLENVEKLAFKIIGQPGSKCGAADSHGDAVDPKALDGSGNKSEPRDGKGNKDASRQKAKPAAKVSVECEASASRPRGSSDVVDGAVPKDTSTPKDSSVDGADSAMGEIAVDDCIERAMSCLNALNSSQGPTLPTDIKVSWSRNESSGKPAPSPSVSSETSKTRSSLDKSKSTSVSDGAKTGNATTKFSCGKCSFQCVNSSELSKHDCSGSTGPTQDPSRVITVNLVEKNKLECTECTFKAWGSAFEEHLMCHLMLNPYQCLYCKEAFRNRSEISRHVVIVHPTEKMNCALKAMKTAKALIEKAVAKGTHTFPVEVKGKVPVISVKKKQPCGVQKSPAAAAAGSGAAAAAASPGAPSDLKKRTSDPPSRDSSQESKPSTVTAPKPSSEARPISKMEPSKKQEAISKDSMTPLRKPDTICSRSVAPSDSSSQEKVEISVTSNSVNTGSPLVKTVSAVNPGKMSAASVESASSHPVTVENMLLQVTKAVKDHFVGSLSEAKKKVPADDPDRKKSDTPGQNEISKASEGRPLSDGTDLGTKPIISSSSSVDQEKRAETIVERLFTYSKSVQSIKNMEKMGGIDQLDTLFDIKPTVLEPVESNCNNLSTEVGEKSAAAITPGSVDEDEHNVPKEEMNLLDEKGKDKAEEEEMRVSVEESNTRPAPEGVHQSSTISEDVAKSKPAQSKDMLSKTTMEEAKDTVAFPAKTASRMTSSQEGEEPMETDPGEEKISESQPLEAQEPGEVLGRSDDVEMGEKKEQHCEGAAPSKTAPGDVAPQVFTDQSTVGVTDSESPEVATSESKGVAPGGLTEVVGVPNDEAPQNAPEEVEPTASEDVAPSKSTQMAPSALTTVTPDASTDTTPEVLTETAPSASADSALGVSMDTSCTSADPSVGASRDTAPSASTEETLGAPSAAEEVVADVSGVVAPSASMDAVPSAVVEVSPSVLAEGVTYASPEVDSALKEVPSSASTVDDPSVTMKVTPSACEEVTPSACEEVTPSASEEVAHEEVAPGASEESTPSTMEEVTIPSASGEEIPGACEEIIPDVCEKVSPDASEMVIPRDSEKVTPDASEKVSSDAPETVTPCESEKVSSDAPGKVTPGASEEMVEGSCAEVMSRAEDEENEAEERIPARTEGAEELEAQLPSVSAIEPAASKTVDCKEEDVGPATAIQEHSLDVEAQSAETAVVSRHQKDEAIQEMDVDPSPEEPASHASPVGDVEVPTSEESRSRTPQEASSIDNQVSEGSEVQSSLLVAPSTNAETANIAELSANEEKKDMERTEIAACLENATEKSEESASTNDSEGVGLKIIASFSLQNADGGAEGGSQEAGSAGLSHWEDSDLTGEKTDRTDVLSEHATADSHPSEPSTLPGEDDPPISPGKPDEQSPTAQGFCEASGAMTSSTSPPSQPPRLADPPPTVVPVMENFYVCGFGHCPFSSALSGDFREHLLLSHIDQKLYHCYHCGSMMINDDSLLRHMSNHAVTNFRKTPLYLCGADPCRFGTNLTQDLVSHLESCHPNLTYFMCKECEDYFRSTDHLVKHLEANLLNVVSCPHCSAKGSQRKEILKHIALYHPGKAKMVSVGKQLLCRERKMNNYFPQAKPVETPVPSHLMQHLAAPVATSDSRGTNGPEASFATSPARPSDPATLPDCFITSAYLVNVKKEKVDHGYDVALGNLEENKRSGSHQGASTQSSNTSGPQDLLCCQQCTFVAKDSKQMTNHASCHLIPISKKQRFVCMYCPQNVADYEGFKHHIQSHPGLIQFHRYKCKQCLFDTNQRFMMLHHIRKTNINHEIMPNEGDMFEMIEETLPSVVLICDHCDFKTRAQISMDIHNRREHHTDAADQSSKVSLQDGSVSHLAPQEIERQKLLALANSGTPASGGNPETSQLRFKCPICLVLFPKQSGLKEHIRMHSDVEVITLTMFTCKYCTTSSTSKDIISSHLKEKHPTKDSCLIKKLLSLDVKSLGPRSPAQSPSPVLAPAANNVSKQSTAEEKQPIWIIILPGTEDGKDTAYLCQICFKLYQGLDSFRDHCQELHKNMLLMSRRIPNGALFQLSTSFVDVSQDLEGTPGLKDEALIIPDKQVYTCSMSCPKCRKYVTYFRQNLMLHLQKQHSEITLITENQIPRVYPTIPPPPVDAAPPLPPPPPPAKQPRTRKSKGDLYTVGSALLDEKISPLYRKLGSAQTSSTFQCLLCKATHTKKYFMHVHLVQHLDLQLCQCTHCDYSGFQKYKIVNHMKKFHPDRQVKIKFLEVDIDARVREFLPLIKKVRGSPKAATAASTAPPSPVVHLPEENQSVVELKKSESSGKDSSVSLGSDKLNESLSCLYEMTETGHCRCLLCAADFQRRFAIHRHLLTHHLKVSLLKCHYCMFKGVEKNQIIDHILAKHKNEAIQADTLKVNFREKVTALLERHGSLSKYSLSPSEKRAVKRQGSSLLTLLTSSSSAGPSSSKLARGPGGSSFSPDSSNQAFQLGKEPLHAALLPLLKEGPKGSLKCRKCNLQFPKRYSMHRHILMKHLRLPILKCSLCSFTGYERYQVSTHISESHGREKAMVTERDIDVKAAVAEFLGEQPEKQTLETSKEESVTEDVKPDVDELNASIAEGDRSSDGTGHLVVSKFWQKKKAQPPSPTSPSSTSSKGSRFPPAGRPKKQRRDVFTNIRVLHNGNKFYCGKCQFQSVHRSNVQRHILRVHEGYTEKECSQCGYKTLSSLLMEEHMKEIHGIKESSSEERAIPSQAASEDQDSSKMAMFACAYCSFETNDDKIIFRHTVENHGEQMESLAPGDPYVSINPSRKRSHDTDDDSGLDPKFPKLDWLGSRTTTKPSFADRDREESHCCPYCAFISQSKVALRFHMRKHRFEPKEPETLKRKPFSSIMQTHTKDGRPLRFECTFCGIRTRQQTRMRYHYNRHVGYKPYKCTSCDSFFASPDQMRKHAKRMDHSSEFLYMRDDATEKKVNSLVEGGRLNIKKKKKKGPLKKGRKQPRPEASTSTPVAAAVVPPSPNLSSIEGEDDMEGEDPAQVSIFECTMCPAKRACFQNLKRHHVKEHRKNKLLWRDAETGFVANLKGVVSRFTGPVWELSVKEEDMFEELVQEDRKTFNCKRCQFQSPMVQAIKSHLKSHMVKTFLCAYCTARYFHREMASTHQSKVHPGQTPWLIQLTEAPEGVTKTEGSPSTWKLETLASDESLSQPSPATTPAPAPAPASKGPTRFFCSECSFSTTSKLNFRLHLAHHPSFTRLAPYLPGDTALKCGCCPYIAESSVDFSNHIATHMNDRTVKCAYCDYSAFLPSYVRRHQKSSHPDLPAAVETIKTSAVNVVLGKTDGNDKPKVVNLQPVVLVKDIRHMSKGDMEAHLYDMAISKDMMKMQHAGEDSSIDMSDAYASAEEEEIGTALANVNVKEGSMEVDEDSPELADALGLGGNVETDAEMEEEDAKASCPEAGEEKGLRAPQVPGTGKAAAEKVQDEVDGPGASPAILKPADPASQSSQSRNSGGKDGKDTEGDKNLFSIFKLGP